MLSVEAIAQALLAALPIEHQSQAPTLARALANHISGRANAPLAPELMVALRAMAGREIAAGDSVVSFGSGNSFGDITIGEVVGRDKITIAVALPASLLTPHEQRNRQALIRNVRTVAIAPLDRLLAEEPYLELALSEKPDAVSGPPTPLARATSRPPTTIPPGMAIAEIFDRHGGALLILGAPGSGKTALLLELCRALLDRAEGDERLPIPIVFNLASWSAHRDSLADWMAEELDTNFNVSRQMAREWVEGDAILPLLDGLDEVAPAARGACVRAVNDYRGDHPVPIAVCAREADYCAIATKLQLLSAVLIHPLRDAQVVTYLDRSGEALAGLRQALAGDAALREIATTPLMLSVMAAASIGKPAEAIVGPAYHSMLWETYLDAMFRRGAPRHRVGREQTLVYLRWLAKALQRHPQTVFHLEHLQPDWLPTSADRWWYTLVDRLGSTMLVGGVALTLCTPIDGFVDGGTVALVCALVAGLYGGQPRTLALNERSGIMRDLLVGGLLVGLTGFVAGMTVGPLQGVVGGTSFALLGAIVAVIAGGPMRQPRTIITVESLYWSGKRALRVGKMGLGIGLAVGFINGLFARGWSFAPLFALVVGGAFALVVGGLGGLTPNEVSSAFVVNQGVRRSARMALLLGALVTILAGLIVGGIFTPLLLEPNPILSIEPGAPLSVIWQGFSIPLRRYVQAGVKYGVASGLMTALVYGGYPVLSHAALRLVLWRRGALPLSLVPFLDACVDYSLLRRVGGGYSFIHRLLQDHLMGAERIGALPKRDAAGPPPSIAGFIDYFTELRQRTLAHVQAIPPGRSTWAPCEGAPTCADLVVGLAVAEDQIIGAFVGEGWRGADPCRRAGASHEILLAQLEAGHKAAIEQLRGLSDSVLQQPRIAPAGGSATGWQLLMDLVEHESRCCGQIATYLTLLSGASGPRGMADGWAPCKRSRASGLYNHGNDSHSSWARISVIQEVAMQIQHEDWRVLVNEAAYSLVREQAPNEIPLYVRTRDRYLADPEGFAAPVVAQDEAMGAGMIEVLQNFSQTLFPLLGPALGAILSAVAAAIATEAPERAVAAVRKLFAKPEPILTQEQLAAVAAEIKLVAARQQQRYNLDPAQTQAVVDAIIARLALAKKS